MTDPRGKTNKANSTTLNRHRRSSSTMLDMTMIVINDDTDSVSDGDARRRPVLNANVTVTAENTSMGSPWEDETGSRNDFSSCDTEKEEEDAIVSPRTSSAFGKTDRARRKSAPSDVHANNRKNNSLVGRTTTTPALDALINSVQRANRAPRIKWSTVGKRKPQKYHWSGTFRTRRTSLTTGGNAAHHRIRPLNLSSRGDSNDRSLNCNYSRQHFDRERRAADDNNIHRSNEFEPPDDAPHEEDMRIDNVLGCVDVCGDMFGETDFKDYDDAVQRGDNVSLSVACDLNVHLRQRVTDHDKDVVDAGDDLYTNQTEDASTLCLLLSPTADGVDGEGRNDLRGAKKSVDSASMNGRSHGRRTTDGKKSAARSSRCCKFGYSLLAFLKDVVLFLLLPATYVAFFIYVQGIEGK